MTEDKSKNSGASSGGLHMRQQILRADDLVFTSSTGGPIEPYNFTRAFQTICARHKLCRIRLHDLRHGVGTLLKDFGVPARDAQLILGQGIRVAVKIAVKQLRLPFS